jgi:hypothetical protein
MNISQDFEEAYDTMRTAQLRSIALSAPVRLPSTPRLALVCLAECEDSCGHEYWGTLQGPQWPPPQWHIQLAD